MDGQSFLDSIMDKLSGVQLSVQITVPEKKEELEEEAASEDQD